MDSRCQDILDEIFSNPNYYAAYILHKAKGSLGKQGDSHAEQNHSSVAASLGKGAKFDLSKHCEKLLDRHVQRVKKWQNNEEKLCVSISKYKSNYKIERDVFNDVKAKEALSTFAYKDLFTKNYKRSRYLKVEVNNGRYEAWESRDSDKLIIHSFSNSY